MIDAYLHANINQPVLSKFNEHFSTWRFWHGLQRPTDGLVEKQESHCTNIACWCFQADFRAILNKLSCGEIICPRRSCADGSAVHIALVACRAAVAQLALVLCTYLASCYAPRPRGTGGRTTASLNAPLRRGHNKLC